MKRLLLSILSVFSVLIYSQQPQTKYQKRVDEITHFVCSSAGIQTSFLDDCLPGNAGKYIYEGIFQSKDSIDKQSLWNGYLMAMENAKKLKTSSDFKREKLEGSKKPKRVISIEEIQRQIDLRVKQVTDSLNNLRKKEE